MARARSIKPNFFHDVELTALPPLARLLFAGLWCYADRAGRLEDRPRQIKHDILPDDRCDVVKLLDMLEDADPPFIIRYESGGRRFIQVRTFGQHQNPHVKEPASTIPAPGLSGASPNKTGASPADSLNPVTDNGNPEPATPPQAGPPPSDAGDADTSKIATLPNREGLKGPPYRTAWQFDTSFEPLVALYRESGAAVIDDDFAEAHGAWTRLDWEARAQRVNAFRAKVEAGEYSDPAFIHRPCKFIESEWKRPIVTRQQQQKTKAREVRII